MKKSKFVAVITAILLFAVGLHTMYIGEVVNAWK